jgi:hypothetical protein
MQRILFFCILFVSTHVFGQTFSENREKFAKEFHQLLSDYGKGDYQEFSKKVVAKELIENPAFTAAYFSKMVAVSNQLVEKKMKPYPEIYNYVYSVVALVQTKQSTTSFNAWHSTIDKLLLSKNAKKFEDFIDLSASFFSARKIAIASNFTWFYEGGSFSFDYSDKPIFRFEGGNLACKIENNRKSSKSDPDFLDSLVIYKTSGEFDPLTKKWTGKNGKVTWEKVGLSAQTTFAVLENYEVNCKVSFINVDSVLLTSTYFKQPILGSLTDKAITINREIDRVYPQFTSSNKLLEINKIVPSIDYKGGFSLEGANFVGKGTVKIPAAITFYKNDKPFIRQFGQEVIVNQQSLRMFQSASTIYLGATDSIYHPSVSFFYDIPAKKIEFARSASGLGQAPFQDSYHQIDVYAPKIVWQLDSLSLSFTYDVGTSQEKRSAVFESKAFFDNQLYTKFQGLQGGNSINDLYQYSYKNDVYEFDEGTAATALKLIIDQAKPILLELSNAGFIQYDLVAKRVKINSKLENFVKAKMAKTDYDNIRFIADLRPIALQNYTEDELRKDPNLGRLKQLYQQQNSVRKAAQYFAKINLKSFDLKVISVDEFNIAEKQQAFIVPDNSEITMKRNRSVDFTGWVNVGKLEVKVLNGSFNYEKFKINLDKTASAIFKVKPLTEKDGSKSIALQSAIQGIIGEILIDSTINKSGNDLKISSFPKLIVGNKTNVYYNSKEIFKGAYDSTRFYYTIAPFVLDSLANFKENSFALNGELTSAGIFPTIKQALKIMPDYSLGFSMKAPKEGYSFYATSAAYSNKIVLSNNGLQGAGSIDFITANAESKLLSFLPDSTIGMAKFTNKPVESGIEYPDMNADLAFISFLPKEAKMYVRSHPKSGISIFNNEANLKGTAVISKLGVTATGSINYKKAASHSTNFVFKRWNILADTSSFILRNDSIVVNQNPVAFEADNVKSKISFKERVGEFYSNSGATRVYFPDNQFACNMDKFVWKMESIFVDMEAGSTNQSRELDIDGPNFFSTNPKQDSLNFKAQKARFDISQKIIYCSGVNYVPVADARIYPDSSKLLIRLKAKIDPFVNAEIIANSITKYHSFNSVEATILTRKSYEAKGKYNYYNADSLLTQIDMKTIYVDTSFQTIAKGVIAKDSAFQLSKQFDFYGNLTIQAGNKFLLFDGATRINHSCDKFDRNWMSFSAPIDPQNIQIPVSTEMKNLEKEPLSAGIVWRNSPNTDSIVLYPTFLSKIEDKTDPIFFTSNGFLQYNKKSAEFQIGSKEKLKNQVDVGNYLALNTKTCSMAGNGTIQLGFDYGAVKIDAVGGITYDQESGETAVNMTAKFQIPLMQNQFEAMAKKINNIDGLKLVELKNTNLEQALLTWTDQKTTDKFKSDYTLKGEVKKLPNNLEDGIVITGIKMQSFDKVDAQEKGLKTSVSTASLVNFYGIPILKNVPFRLFLQQIYSENGADRFGMQFNLPAGNDYYFDYEFEKKDGFFRVISGDVDLMNDIRSLKSDKKQHKNFKFDAATQQIYLSKFLRLFEL